MGLLLLPNFGLGLIVGTGDLVCQIISLTLLKNVGVIQVDNEKNSDYRKHIQKSLLATSLFAPIAEEGLFRGFIQPLLTKSVQILVPAAAVAFFGAGLSVATAVSILATSIFFGAAHYMNPHKNAHIQAISCTIGGLVLGVLSAQFGIAAAFAAHIANNTILSSMIAFIPSDNDPVKVRKLRKFETANLPT